MNAIKKFLNRIRFVMPSSLPTSGTTEFDSFAESIFTTYGFPDMPSYRQAIAAQIMHLPVDCTRKSKRAFALSIRKAQANEIAYQVISAIREQEKNAQAQVPASPPA